MYVLLMVTGVIAALAGGAMIGFGVQDHEFSLGNTLIIAGTIAVSAGLILIGLGAAVRHLARIAEALARAAPRVVRAGDAAEAGARPAAARIPFPPKSQNGQASAEPGDAGVRRPAAMQPLGTEASDDVPLSPHGFSSPEVASPHVAQPASAEAAGPAAARTRPSPAVRTAPEAAAVGSAAVESPRGPRLDPPWRPNAPAERQPEPERAARGLFDSLWPTEGGRRPPTGMEARRSEPSEPRDRQADAGAEAVHDTPGAAPASRAPVAADRSDAPPGSAPAEPRRAVSILKSGVVDGMAYTLYSDGSIEAELPEGTIRFTSIEDLRRHLDTNS
jgi:hypothetical protein